jgi:hypothetical protein
MRDRLPILVAAAFVAVALGLGLYAIADGIKARDSRNVIAVTGSSRQRVSSDFVIWDASVAAQAPTTQAAAKQLGVWAAGVSLFLRDNGIAEQEVTVAPIQTETLYEQTSNGPGAVTGYKLTRSFEVRSSRVKQVAAAVEATSALLQRGIPLAAQPIQYVFTKLGDLRPRLVSQATQDALVRARALVETTGGRIGRLRSVDVGVFQVTAPNSTQVSDYGVYDTSTLDKDVIAVVNASFALR